MADDNLRNAVSPTEADNTASNPFYHVLSDGTNPLSVTGGVLDVNATVVLDTSYVDDSAFVIGTDRVNAQGFLADETATDSVDEGDIGLARMTLDRRMIVSAEQGGSWDIGTVTTLTGITNDVNIADGGNSITVDDGGTPLSVTGTVAISGTVAVTQSGTWTIDSITNDVTVDAVDLDIRDLTHVSDSVKIGDGTETVEVNADGSINVVTSDVAGTRVHDHDKSAATAKNGTANHDYTVAGTTFLLKKVSIAGAGRMKAEIQVGPLAGLVSKLVLFKEREGTQPHEFVPAIAVPATSTGTVRIIKTQRSLGSLFMYSTIEGDDQ